MAEVLAAAAEHTDWGSTVIAVASLALMGFVLWLVFRG